MWFKFGLIVRVGLSIVWAILSAAKIRRCQTVRDLGGVTRLEERVRALAPLAIMPITLGIDTASDPDGMTELNA